MKFTQGDAPLNRAPDTRLATLFSERPREVLTEFGKRVTHESPSFFSHPISRLAEFSLPSSFCERTANRFAADRATFLHFITEADIPMLEQLVKDDRYDDPVQVLALSALTKFAPLSIGARRSLLHLAVSLEGPFRDEAARALRNAGAECFTALVIERWRNAPEEREKLARVILNVEQLPEACCISITEAALAAGTPTESLALFRAFRRGNSLAFSSAYQEELAARELSDPVDLKRGVFACLLLRNSSTSAVNERLSAIAVCQHNHTLLRAAALLALGGLPKIRQDVFLLASGLAKDEGWGQWALRYAALRMMEDRRNLARQCTYHEAAEREIVSGLAKHLRRRTA